MKKRQDFGAVCPEFLINQNTTRRWKVDQKMRGRPESLKPNKKNCGQHFTRGRPSVDRWQIEYSWSTFWICLSSLPCSISYCIELERSWKTKNNTNKVDGFRTFEQYYYQNLVILETAESWMFENFEWALQLCSLLVAITVNGNKTLASVSHSMKL